MKNVSTSGLLTEGYHVRIHKAAFLVLEDQPYHLDSLALGAVTPSFSLFLFSLLLNLPQRPLDLDLDFGMLERHAQLLPDIRC